MLDTDYTPPHRTGLAHAFYATGYSLAGFRRLLNEAAFRQELLGLAFIVTAFLAFGVAPASWAVALILFALLAAVEALNTAIEEIVDRVSPERSDFAKHAKDLGSFAVFCLLAANVVHVAWALYAAL